MLLQCVQVPCDCVLPLDQSDRGGGGHRPILTLHNRSATAATRAGCSMTSAAKECWFAMMQQLKGMHGRKPVLAASLATCVIASSKFPLFRKQMGSSSAALLYTYCLDCISALSAAASAVCGRPDHPPQAMVSAVCLLTWTIPP